jgi:hypothetical protein
MGTSKTRKYEIGRVNKTRDDFELEIFSESIYDSLLSLGINVSSTNAMTNFESRYIGFDMPLSMIQWCLDESHDSTIALLIKTNDITNIEALESAGKQTVD